MKKIIAALMVLCLTFSLCGCAFLKDISDSTGKVEPKVFEYDGLSIELTTEFLRMDFLSEENEFTVGTEDLSIFGIKIVEEGVEDISLEDYAETFHSMLEYDDVTSLTYLDGIPTMQYTEPDDLGNDTRIAVMVYKGTDCFWLIIFTAEPEVFDKEYDNIVKYAKSVKCQ